MGTKTVLAAILFGFCLIFISSSPSVAQPILMRMSVHQSSTDWLTRDMHESYKAEVEKASGGRIKVKIYYGGSLHKGAEGFDALRSGITDFAPAYPLWKAGYFYLAHVVSLPFAFKNNIAAGFAVDELYNKYFKSEFDRLGVIPGINWIMTNSVLLTKKPVRKLEDIKGLKIAGTGPMLEHIKALGGVGVNMITPEIYNALQRGIVDGVYYTPSTMVQWHFIEVAKYYTDFPIAGAYLSYCTNPSWYQKLPPDLQAILYKVNRKAETHFWNKIIKDKDKEVYAKIKEARGEVITLPAAEKHRWVDAMKPLWEEFIRKNEAKGKPASQLVDDWRKTVGIYEKLSDDKLLEMATKSPIQGISMRIGK